MSGGNEGLPTACLPPASGWRERAPRPAAPPCSQIFQVGSFGSKVDPVKTKDLLPGDLIGGGQVGYIVRRNKPSPAKPVSCFSECAWRKGGGEGRGRGWQRCQGVPALRAHARAHTRAHAPPPFFVPLPAPSAAGKASYCMNYTYPGSVEFYGNSDCAEVHSEEECVLRVSGGEGRGCAVSLHAVSARRTPWCLGSGPLPPLAPCAPPPLPSRLCAVRGAVVVPERGGAVRR